MQDFEALFDEFKAPTDRDQLLLRIAHFTSQAASALPPAGLATEAKQDAMIAELMKDSDFELTCVEDTVTGVVYVMRIYRLETDGSIVVDYVDATGSVVVPPNPSDLVVCNPNATLSAILAELQTQSGILQDIDDNTDGLEALATSSLAELQAINLNTDGIEALLTAGNVNTAAISAELISQSAQLGTIITSLTTINTSIQTADTNNVNELQNVQGDLANVITELQAIGVDTTAIEATLNAIETLVTSGNGDLALIQTNTLNTVTELQSIDATLLLLNGQFTGTPTIIRADISGNPAYVVPAGTYYSVQAYVETGSISDGTITYNKKIIFDETMPIKGATHPGVTFNATGATAYVKLMTN